MINKDTRYIMWVYVVVFAMFCVSISVVATVDYINRDINIEYKLDKSNDLDKRSAFFMSKIFVRRQLKLPDFITFSSFSEAAVRDIDNNTYQVMAGYSMNDGFGTITHKQYICVLRYAEYDNWILESLDIP